MANATDVNPSLASVKGRRLKRVFVHRIKPLPGEPAPNNLPENKQGKAVRVVGPLNYSQPILGAGAEFILAPTVHFQSFQHIEPPPSPHRTLIRPAFWIFAFLGRD